MRRRLISKKLAKRIGKLINDPKGGDAERNELLLIFREEQESGRAMIMTGE